MSWPVSSGLSNHWQEVEVILRLFYPQYFDPESPSYVDQETMQQLVMLAEEFRPWCLPEERQNFAQAMYSAYLVSVRNETSSGQSTVQVAGPIVSEKEGDIQVTYASPSTGSASTTSKRPASDPWDAWNKMWMSCSRGSITSRFGDPLRPVS